MHTAWISRVGANAAACGELGRRFQGIYTLVNNS